MKRRIILITIIGLYLLLLPLIAHAVTNDILYSGSFKTFNWSLDDNGQLVISGSGSIPKQGPWLTYNNEIKSIIIGDGIDAIERWAFRECPELKSVCLGKDIVTLEEEAFSECRKLTSLELMGNSCILHGKAFFPCYIAELVLSEDSNYQIIDHCVLSLDGRNLVLCLDGKEEIDIPIGVTIINDEAFWCNRTTISVDLPNTIKTIGDSAFGNCDNLSSITIPASVELLKQNAFWDCYSLKGLSFIGKNITLEGYWTFGFCESLQTVILPQIFYIDEDNVGSSFMFCKNLQTVVIGEGTESLPPEFFSKCDNLRDVYIPASVKSINETTFDRASKNLILHCVKGSYAERFAIEYGYNYDCPDSLSLPNDLKIIENYAFEDTDCTIVIIPDGCTTIGERAFAGCSNLIYVKIPATVTSYPVSAFEGCNKNLVIDWEGH